MARESCLEREAFCGILDIMSNKGKELLIWVLIAAGLGAIVLGIYAVIATPAKTNGVAERLIVPVSEQDHKRGGAGAKAVLVEYSDLQCPACKYFYGMVKQLEQEKGDAVQVVYRHFPLQQHQYARNAAIAAEAAGRQGKFWEMHGLLFEKQDEWAKSENIQQTLVGYATLLKLDIGRFMGDTQAKELADKVEQSVAEGTKQGIAGTPTFYLNGRLVQFRSYE